jgi:hypothetical protein
MGYAVRGREDRSTCTFDPEIGNDIWNWMLWLPNKFTNWIISEERWPEKCGWRIHGGLLNVLVVNLTALDYTMNKLTRTYVAVACMDCGAGTLKWNIFPQDFMTTTITIKLTIIIA